MCRACKFGMLMLGHGLCEYGQGPRGKQHSEFKRHSETSLTAQLFGVAVLVALTLNIPRPGNDIAMFEGRNRGILVSNSQPDLLDWLSEQRRQQQGEDDGRLLLAGKERARGILEGLAAFGFL